MKFEAHAGREFCAKLGESVKEIEDGRFDLLTQPGRVLTKESIAEHVWGDAADAADSFDFLYTHLKNLRRKLQEKGAGDYIRSVYGVGYKLSAE